jgi:hypothetical protein
MELEFLYITAYTHTTSILILQKSQDVLVY